MEYATLALGLLLPWALGAAALLALRDTAAPLDAPGELAWLLGAGYPIGAILLTAWMRVLSIGGVRFGALSIGVPLLLAAVALGAWGARRHGQAAALAATRRAWKPPADLSGFARAVWWGLLGWIALRFALLALDVAWQPLYPWEAWIAWATKARVWFELGRMAPFVDTDAWWAANATANAVAWFDASPSNPAMLPLLQVWSCVSLGRWDDALMNWPWWQMAAALALASYGGLRRLGASELEALAGAYFVASLPLANVHVALAGYADLPLAAVYAMAVLALLHWISNRTARGAVVVVLLVVACPLVRTAGAYWALTLLPGLAVAVLPRAALKITLGAFGIVALALSALAQTNVVVAGRDLHLDFAPAWSTLWEGKFLLGSWHLLWYGVVGAALLAWRRLLEPPLLGAALVVAAGLLLLSIPFAFPGVSRLVADVPGIARASLHLAPTLALFIVLAFRGFASRCAIDEPPPEPAAPAESSVIKS